VKKIKITLCLWVAINLSACVNIKSYFPDKEKDYQFTTEIPELQIPEDLSNSKIHYASTIRPSQPSVISPIIPDAAENELADNGEENTEILVELVEYSGGTTRIRIEDSIERTWRVVGKALSRNAIEIINRNEYESFYSVQYDPDFKKFEDGSLWDEVLFIFGSDPAKEQEYKIRLAENGLLTEVIVLDKEDQPLSKGGGLKLLHLLYKTIKEDLNNTN